MPAGEYNCRPKHAALAAKKADVLVICTSTWGCSQKKDPLMQAAAARAGATWVRIDTFIGDPKNRALQFKHTGVAWHPGDQGMQKIADAIWAALKPQLETPLP